MFQTEFTLTQRDSAVKRHLQGSQLGRMLEQLMHNGSEGPDFGCLPPEGFESKYSGSVFDKCINMVLFCNVVWLVVQSVFDLNDVTEPHWFSTVDLLFSFLYIGEVCVKLCWWSWEEYWMSIDNRFDFVTSVILGLAGIGFLFFDVPRDCLRYVNLLRLIRLLKALNNIPEYARIMTIISRMITTCGDVLAMNLLVIYLWTAWGMQLYGGKLVKDNPALKDQDSASDFFDGNLQIFNFNDMVMGMVTMFFVTITQWNNDVTTACLALHPPNTWGWLISYVYWLTFYVASPLIAFNVFTAFSIDIFLKLEEMCDPENQKPGEIAKNLAKHRETFANDRGMALHITENVNLRRERVYKAMFDEDDDDSKDDGSSDSDKGIAEA